MIGTRLVQRHGQGAKSLFEPSLLLQLFVARCDAACVDVLLTRGADANTVVLPAGLSMAQVRARKRAARRLADRRAGCVDFLPRPSLSPLSPQAGAHAASIGRSTAHTGAPSHTAASERIKLEQGAVDTLESLLLAGADISVTDRHDRTLLHIVAGAYLLPMTAMNTGTGVATSPDEPHARWARDSCAREALNLPSSRIAPPSKKPRR